MKKQKEDLQSKLAHRKYKITNRFYYWIYYFIMTKIVGKKYKAHYEYTDDIRECKGPCFLIWNHLSRIDHMYLMEAAYPKRVTIVAEYNEFFRSHLHFAFKLNNVLPKKNYCTNDITGIKAMSSIIKQGGCVAFSPEGTSSIFGCNQPIVAGTGHFLQHYNVPVYFMEFRGQYLMNHKVCLDERYSDTYVNTKLLFTPEQLKQMTGEEIDNKINEVFRHDEYEWQKEHHQHWQTNGEICKNLEDMCYKCPKCGKELTMVASKDEIKCTSCGNGTKMNEYYEFLPFDDSCIIPESPSKWVAQERMDLIKEIRENPNYSHTEHVKLGYLPKYHYVKHKGTSELCGEGDITFDHSGIHYRGTRHGEEWNFDLSYKTVFTLIMVTDLGHFSLFVNGEYYEFFPERRSVGKLILLTEEMHRYHVNTWKNFPWNEYMYK